MVTLIHEFTPNGVPYFDDEGDQMIGGYYQFLDENDNPITDLIGPYRDARAARKAAQRAVNRHDY